ncbi:MAG: hypothetical protein FJ265_12640 [Planctomycetes bacterium]|nr:hypothetical protein [Planctomycetota bacterium]
MKGRGKPRREIFACPHCGADVPVGSRSCKECGSDASTGWQDQEEIDYQGLDLPQGYSRDEDHPARGGTGGFLPERRPLWFVVAAILLVLVFVAFAVLRWRGYG